MIGCDRYEIVSRPDKNHFMSVPDRLQFETLSIRTLGSAAIELCSDYTIDGSEATGQVKRLRFESRTVEAVLIYLAFQARPLGREVLAEFLWPERDPDQSRANLRVAIHRLRRQLEPFLWITRQSVALNPDARIDLDALRFEQYLASDQLELATATYQGDFLDGFYVDGSPAFEQWVLFERERLRTLALFAWQQQIEQMTTRGQLQAAISAAQRLLELDPLHEPAHRQLMRLLAQVGHRSAALAQYVTCRNLLATELAAIPDEATTILYERIRLGESKLQRNNLPKDDIDESSMRHVRSVLPGSGRLESGRANSLPPQLTPFIGRETELERISFLLANSDCRLLTLIGVGGVGKTRLAIESASRQANTFVDGICFVELAAVADADLVPVAIAQKLAIQNLTTDLMAQISSHLHSRELLLILDNFEHLIDAAELVTHLICNAPRLKILITSRQRLALLEEWLLPISGLLNKDGWTSEAGRLFVSSALRVEPGFTTAGQEEAITAICDQVEGLPLALELAASWTRVMSCQAIARLLKTNLDILSTDIRNLAERHRSLRKLMEQSWRLLSEQEQIILRRVSAFRSGWMLEEAIPVAEATLPLLVNLVDKSLVRSNQNGRFDLHPLVRQYAAEQLDVSAEAEMIRQRHFVAYLQLVRRSDRQLRGGEAAGWYEKLDLELDNIRAAWEWALTTEQYIDAAWLGVALCHFWNVRTHWHEAALWLEQLLPHHHRLPMDLRLGTLLGLYHVWRAREDFQSIDRFMNELSQLRAESTQLCLRGVAWRCEAVATADFAQSAEGWERSIEVLREAISNPLADSAIEQYFGVLDDSDYQLAFSLFRFAIRLTDVGEYEQAERLSAESLALFRRRGNRDYIVYPLGNLGRLALLRGDIVQARLLFQEAVDIASTIKNVMGLGDWLPRLGIVTLYAGDAAEARRLLIESLNICEDWNNAMYLSRIYTYLAEVALWEGDISQTRQWLDQALTNHANPRWLRTELVDCLWVAARWLTATGKYLNATTLFGLAEQVRQSIHYAPAGPIRTLADEALTTVQCNLDEDVFDEAFTAGRRMSIDEALRVVSTA